MKHFSVINKDSNCFARTGKLETTHGTVNTPVFMPVGTVGAVKGITPYHLEQTGASVILANTYHMHIRPGVEAVEKLGGLHELMSWDKPILTDSGGYQVFSLSSLNKVTDAGVEFSSHVDGKKLKLDPESAINIQNRLGADIIMCFDQCTHFPCSDEELKKAVYRTIRWAEDCKSYHKNGNQLLFGIVQGGIDYEMRKKCSKELVDMDFDGYSIGGLSVGEGHDNMIETVEFTTPMLPEEKPRYLMGVGTPADIVAAVRAGVDMFDCVMPTRNGRNAFAFTEKGAIRLRNSVHIDDKSPIEEECDCYCCRNFSRGSLRHFFNVGEMLGPIMVALHNIHFYQRLMAEIRRKIAENEFDSWAEETLKRYDKAGFLKNGD